MTREALLAHIAMIAKHDPAYAEKARKWYARMLPWIELNEKETQ